VNYEIYPMIVRQFRQLLMAREVLDERGNTQAIMRDLGVPQFVADNLGKQAANFTMLTLEKIYFQLMKIEEDSKNGMGDLETAIDALIVTAAG
jgi:DNA polymerase III delta subunit